MSRMSKAARRCVTREIRRQYQEGAPRKQGIAIAFSKCRRKGFRSIPKKR